TMKPTRGNSSPACPCPPSGTGVVGLHRTFPKLFQTTHRQFTLASYTPGILELPRGLSPSPPACRLTGWVCPGEGEGRQAQARGRLSHVQLACLAPAFRSRRLRPATVPDPDQRSRRTTRELVSQPAVLAPLLRRPPAQCPGLRWPGAAPPH